MHRGLFLSILLHIGLFLVIGVGFPLLFPKTVEEIPQVLSVEIVPIKEFTNLKKSKKPVGKAKKAKLKNKKAVPKTKKEVAKPEPDTKKIPLPDPVKTPPPPEKKEAKKKEQPKPPEPKPQPKKAVTPPEPKPKKKKPKKKSQEDEFAALLSKLEQETVTEDAEEAEEARDASPSKSDEYNPTIPLSMSEKDAIRNQFKRCWRMPAGAMDDYGLAVRVRALFNADGSVREVGLVRDQVARYQSDTFFRAAADAAIRAVQLCSPLENLPMDKYDAWKDIEFNFDPMEMLY